MTTSTDQDDGYIEDDLEEFSPDADLTNADWTKQSWDLPPYLSPEFFDAIGGPQNLEGFKQTPVYNHAVEQGLIIDDEWAADSIQPVVRRQEKLV